MPDREPLLFTNPVSGFQVYFSGPSTADFLDGQAPSRCGSGPSCSSQASLAQLAGGGRVAVRDRRVGADVGAQPGSVADAVRGGDDGRSNGFSARSVPAGWPGAGGGGDGRCRGPRPVSGGRAGALLPRLAEAGLRPTVFIGTSSGAINAALSAQHADEAPQQAAKGPVGAWLGLNPATCSARSSGHCPASSRATRSGRPPRS